MGILKFTFSNNHLSKEEFIEKIEVMKKKMYLITKSKIDNEEDVKDVIQECIYQSYKNINNLKDINKFDSWVIQILLNCCNQYYRKKKYTEVLDENVSFENKDIKGLENNYDFLTLLNGLNEEEKLIMILYYSDDSTITEIANILNLNENTVKSKIKRAKEKIKIYIERCEENE